MHFDSRAEIIALRVYACVVVVRHTDKLTERAELDGDPQLYNDLLLIILTHAHGTSFDEPRQTSAAPGSGKTSPARRP